MGARPIHTAVLALSLALADTASIVEAQESAVVALVQQLAATPAGAAVGTRDRMTAALREWDREIAVLRAAVETHAGDLGAARAFQLRVDLGLAYRRRGTLSEALRQFEAAAALQPDASDVHLLRAMTLEAAGRADDATRAYQASWARDAANPVKAYLLLQHAHDLDATIRERARRALRDAYARIVAGEYRAAGHPFPTLDLLPDGSSRTPIAADAARVRVFAALADGRLDDAAAALDERASAAADPRDSAAAHVARGSAAEREGRLPDARREYGAALAGTLAGRHALYVGLARLAQVDGDTDAALDAFGRAVRSSPNDPALRREFGAALVAANRPDDAFAEFVAALVVTPDEPDVLAAVGQLFLDTDRPSEAVAPLRRALAVNAGRYETHYALAVALARAGQTDEARREFELFERSSRDAMDGRRRAVAGQAGPDGAAR